MNQGTRTYGWYSNHDFSSDGRIYESDIGDRDYANAPGPVKKQNNLRILGVLDQPVTLENFRPLFEMYRNWYLDVEKDWNVFKAQEGKPLETLHWILGTIVTDPTIDVGIIRYVMETYPSRFTIPIVGNPMCPDDVIIELLNRKPKDDPTKHTRGGEVSCFILANKSLPSHLVDLCARKSRKVSTQSSCVYHPNVSRDTLILLSKEGKSPSVRKDALQKLVERGWLTVK